MAEKSQSGGEQQGQKQEQPDRTVGDIPLLEWVAAGIGALIVAAILVFLVIKAVSWKEAEPPMMHVEAGKVIAGSGSYVLKIDVVNSSDNTAAQAQIEGTLKLGGMEVEKSQATVDYVPGHSRMKAGLQFSHDPDRYQVELRVTGYEEP